MGLFGKPTPDLAGFGGGFFGRLPVVTGFSFTVTFANNASGPYVDATSAYEPGWGWAAGTPSGHGAGAPTTHGFAFKGQTIVAFGYGIKHTIHHYVSLCTTGNLAQNIFTSLSFVDDNNTPYNFTSASAVYNGTGLWGNQPGFATWGWLNAGFAPFNNPVTVSIT